MTTWKRRLGRIMTRVTEQATPDGFEAFVRDTLANPTRRACTNAGIYQSGLHDTPELRHSLAVAYIDRLAGMLWCGKGKRVHVVDARAVRGWVAELCKALGAPETGAVDMTRFVKAIKQEHPYAHKHRIAV